MEHETRWKISEKKLLWSLVALTGAFMSLPLSLGLLTVPAALLALVVFCFLGISCARWDVRAYGTLTVASVCFIYMLIASPPEEGWFFLVCLLYYVMCLAGLESLRRMALESRAASAAEQFRSAQILSLSSAVFAALSPWTPEWGALPATVLVVIGLLQLLVSGFAGRGCYRWRRIVKKLVPEERIADPSQTL